MTSYVQQYAQLHQEYLMYSNFLKTSLGQQYSQLL